MKSTGRILIKILSWILIRGEEILKATNTLGASQKKESEDLMGNIKELNDILALGSPRTGFCFVCHTDYTLAQVIRESLRDEIPIDEYALCTEHMEVARALILEVALKEDK